MLGLRVADAGKNGREAGENTAIAAALQYRTFDAAMLISFIEAQASGDNKLPKAFLHDRFRPEEPKTAVDTWLATDPLNNPNALSPPSRCPNTNRPSSRKRLPSGRSVCQHDRRGESRTAQAPTATSSRPVLYSSILFIGGISGTFRIRASSAAPSILVALISFLATTALP